MTRLLLPALVLSLVPTLLRAQNLDVPLEAFSLTDVGSNLCLVHDAIDQIARKAEIPLGFETVEHCQGGFRLQGDDDVTGMSARVLLDAVLARTGAYGWKEIDGVIVVRPIAAWDDRRSLLNLRVGAFTATNEPVTDVLERILQTLTPPVVWPKWHEHVSPPVLISMRFAGGTMLDALNAMAAAQQGSWEVFSFGGDGLDIFVYPHTWPALPTELSSEHIVFPRTR